MCVGFGCIVTKNLDLFWCEPTDDNDCSHSEILYRIGIEDNKSPFDRPFVRVQFPEWKEEYFQFDERYTLPAWAEENKDEIQNKAIKLLNRVKEKFDSHNYAGMSKITGYAKAKDQDTKIVIVADVEVGTSAKSRHFSDDFVRDMRNLVGMKILVCPKNDDKSWFRGAGFNWHRSWLIFTKEQL